MGAFGVGMRCNFVFLATCNRELKNMSGLRCAFTLFELLSTAPFLIRLLMRIRCYAKLYSLVYGLAVWSVYCIDKPSSV